MAETVNISQISLEASESSENFRGSSGGGGMLGNSSLLRMMGMGSQTEKVIIKGQDFESMANFAEYLKYQLDDLDNISNSHISVSQGSTVSKIFFDQYLMGMNEVEPGNVSQELSNFQPQSKAEVKYKAGNQEYDILIRDINYDEDDQKTQTRTLEDLRNLEVTNKNNGLIQLRSFSRINLGRDKGNITRINQEKEVNLVYM
ncbi:MAG: acriflavin resistance protein, partial [Butyricimonas faecihominis]